MSYLKQFRPLILGATSVVTIFLLLGISIFYSMPSNVLSSRDGGAVRVFTNAVAQQSWVFFTRSPSDPEYEVWSGDNLEEPVSLMRLPQSRPENLGGISRAQRAQGPEMAILVNQIPEEDWNNCIDQVEVADCVSISLDAQTTPVQVENSSHVASACGPAVIIESQATPWQYQDYYDSARLPLQAAVVDIECDEGGDS